MKRILVLSLAFAPCIYGQAPQNEAIVVAAKKNFEIEMSNPPTQKLQWDEPVIQQNSIVLGIADKTFPSTQVATTKYSFKGLVPGSAAIVLNQRDTSQPTKPIVNSRTINITVTQEKK